MKIYSNFREIKSGSISPGILYRSDHPVFDGRKVSDIAIAAGLARINTAINLADSDASLKSKLAVCPWYKELYENGSIIALNMNMFFTEPLFCKKLKRGLLFIIEHESPYLIHCEAGLKRNSAT
jgi:protein tyrosine/serine phosphatase